MNATIGVGLPRLTLVVLVAVVVNCCAPIMGDAVIADRPLKIVVLGDSFTAGFGVSWESGFPARLEQALRAKGIAATVVNAGVSGDTASDGAGRVDRAVPEGTDGVIIELGVNDAEHGVNPNVTKAALDTILRRLRDRHIAVLLTGARAPANLGPEYERAFEAVYRELAATYSVILYPFMFDGVAGDPKLLLFDGEHPSDMGVKVIVERIFPSVEKLIARMRAARRS